jgi:NADH-quinone oxidoreductase subunit A
MWFQYVGLKIFSAGVPVSNAAGKGKAYACGEDVKINRVRPEYTNFFSFAFFFTIMHVVALVVATMPVGVKEVLPLALFYVAASAVGLFVLYRR